MSIAIPVRLAAALALVLLISVLLGPPALAQQKAPFGVAPAAPVASAQTAAPAGSGLVTQTLAWVYAQQRSFHQALTNSVKRLRGEPAAIWFLFGISFLYGVFHAAGPGHGKAVLSSYMIANETQVRRGIALAFAAALVQALAAIAVTVGLAMVVRATGLVIQRTANQLEIASYGLVVGLGLWLVWSKGRGLVGAAAPSAHSHAHELAHAHDHEACGHCGHVHIPQPRDLSGKFSLARAAGLVFAMGLRPCTGAILVLLFALAQGVFWAGVGATFAMAVGTGLAVAVLAVLALGSKHLAVRLAGTGGRRAARITSGLEMFGALLVLVFGVILLAAALTKGTPF